MTTYTNSQLLAVWAKLLPEKVYISSLGRLFWLREDGTKTENPLLEVKPTEMLALCEMLEAKFSNCQQLEYNVELWKAVCPENGELDGYCEISYGSATHIWRASHASWQQKTQALCVVKGIEI